MERGILSYLELEGMRKGIMEEVELDFVEATWSQRIPTSTSEFP